MADSGTNFERLNFEITVNAKDAASSVNLLKNAVSRLTRELRFLSNLASTNVFAGISQNAKQAAAETEISAEKIHDAVKRLYADADKKKWSDTYDAMQRTFGDPERMLAQIESNAAASHWQEMMANAFHGQDLSVPMQFGGHLIDIPGASDEARQAGDTVGREFSDALYAAVGGLQRNPHMGADDIGQFFNDQVVQINEAKEAMQAISWDKAFGSMENAAPFREWASAMAESYGYVEQTAERMWAPLQINGNNYAAKYGAEAGKTYWEHFSVQGGNLGSKISGKMHEGAFNNPMTFGEGLSTSFSNAIEQTKTFTQVSKTLTNVSNAIKPALEGAGVSAEAFGHAMEAAAAPITAAVLVIKAVIKVVTMLIDNFKEFIDLIKKIGKKLQDLNERFNPFEKMKKELSSILALAKRQILRRAINAIIKAVTEGLQEGVANLAEYDEEFGAVVQSYKNSMGLFKNSIGVAVAPIIQYFIPALNKLLAALTSVMNTLARLTALLTGKHTYTIATGYEEIEDSAGSASGAVKELQRTILGFDEINKLNRPSSSGSGGGSGSDDAKSLYETLEVGDWPYDSWGEALLAFLTWLNGTGVPKLREGFEKIAKVVNNFTRNFYDALTFDGVQDQIGELGANIGSALNNFINGGEENGGINWENLGKSIGIGIQSALHFAANFFANFSFFELGANLATAFNSAIKQIDPNDLADTVYGVLTAGIKTAIGFLMDVDLKTLGFKASEFVNRFVDNLREDFDNVKNWSKLWDNIANGIMGFIDGVDWVAFFDTANTLVDEVFKGLNSILDKLLADKRFIAAIHHFIEMILKIGAEWMKLKLRAYFGVFGGNPIVTVAETWLSDTSGGMIGDNGFGLIGVFKSLGAVISNTGDTVNDYSDIVSDASAVTNQFSGRIDVASGAIVTNGKAMSTSISSIGTAAKGANSDVTTATQGITTQFSNLNVNATKPINSFATNTNTQFTSAKNSITNNMKTAKTNAVNNAEALRKDVASKFSSVASNANSEFGKAKTAIVNQISAAKSQMPAFNDVGANIKDGIINGMGDFKGKLDQWANQFKDRILKNFDIKSPSRWARDMVGNYITEGIAEGMTGASPVVEEACAGIKEGITSEFNNMSIIGNVRTNGGIDIAGAIGNQVTSALLSAQTSDTQQPVVCEVYLDRDRIATAVSKGQRAQNRRYSPTAMA